MSRVLGVDPGTRVTGWGVVEDDANGELRLVGWGTLRPPADVSPSQRLSTIHRGILGLLREHRPDAVALEEAFLGRNVRSVIRLAEVRAVCLLAAELEGRVVHELPPALVKKTVSGHGAASKEGVRRAVLAQLGWADEERPPAYDASDALAGAMCALRRLASASLIPGVPMGRRRKGSRRWTPEDVARLQQEMSDE